MIRLLMACVFATVLLAQNRSTPLVILPSADDTQTGELQLREKRANGSNYAGFKAPAALSGNLIWIMPSADGTSGQCWKTDGAFGLSLGSCATGGTGDVVGPAASVASEMPLYDGVTGKLLKRSALTGVLKSAAGVPAIVTGTASDCVKVDGTSGACGSGGGAAATVDLTDFKPTAAGAVITIQAGRGRMGNYASPVIALGTATVTAGTGNIKVFIDSSNNLVCYRATGITTTDGGAMACSTVTTPTYPANSIPIGDFTASTGPAVALVSDDRAFFSNRGISAGTGITVTEGGGTASIGIDTATIPRLGAANAWTAANDFTAATNFYIRRASGAPASGECDAAEEVGQLYARSDAAVAAGTLYVCAKTGASTYAWEIAGSGGGGTEIFPFARDIVMIDEEFLATNSNATDYFGLLGWRVAGTTGAMDMYDVGFNHPGVLRVSQTGAANNHGIIRPFGYTPDAKFGALGSNAGWEAQFTFKTDTYYGTEVKTRVGFYDATNTDAPTDGIWLRYGNSTGCTSNLTDSTWIYEAKTGASSSTTAGPTAPVIDTWYTVAIRSVTATQVGFKVALGTGAFSTEQIITMNVPTSSLLPFVQTVTCDPNAKILWLDRFWYKARVLR